jgi:FkbM family methyltransferase
VRRQLAALADSIGARSALASGRDRVVNLLNGGLGNTIGRRSSLDDEHLTLLLSFALKPDSNCLDVGAHKGLFLEEIQRVSPMGHHIAYEPLPLLCADLVRRFPEMDIRECALSDENGTSSFIHVLSGHEGLSGLVELSYPPTVETKEITVTTQRLDDHLPDGWLPDFVKIDVEAAELSVIAGAMNTLRRAKPIIAFEHGSRNPDLYQMICVDIGLRLFDMDGNGPLDLHQWQSSEGRWNWVAHE